MSDVQCPKPKVRQPKMVTSNSRLHESKIVRITDFGPWTLDIGLSRPLVGTGSRGLPRVKLWPGFYG
jgi:hypothetical protein